MPLSAVATIDQWGLWHIGVVGASRWLLWLSLWTITYKKAVWPMMMAVAVVVDGN